MKLPSPATIRRHRTPLLLSAWVAVGLLLLASASEMPVMRTQEARVLVTAREMVGQPPQGWLLPHMNGQPRLKKPPLAYWVSAASYEVFGVSPLAGRLPMTLAAWSTLAATFLLARRLAGPAAAVWAAGALAGSWLFFKMATLAETDVLMLAAITWAVYAMQRAADAALIAGDPNVRRAGYGWMHVAAVMIALGFLAKGPMALTVLLLMFLIDLAAVYLRGGAWRDGHLWRLVRSGAIVTALVIALPWFAYAFSHGEGRSQLSEDLSDSAVGGGHAKSFVVYGPMLLSAALPWTLVWIAGLLGLARRLVRGWRAGVSERALFLAAWGVALLVPLCFWGNKQQHYLLPLMPPAMIVVGATLAAAVGGTRSRLIDLGHAGRHVVRAIVIGMLVLCGVAIPASIGVGVLQKRIVGEDYFECAAALAVVAALLVLGRTGRLRAATAATVISLMTLFLVRDEWSENKPNSPQAIAAKLEEKYPGAEYKFRDTFSPALSFALNRPVPVLTDDQLHTLRQHSPAGNAVLCIDATDKSDRRALPPGYERVEQYGSENEAVVVSTIDGSRWDKRR